MIRTTHTLAHSNQLNNKKKTKKRRQNLFCPRLQPPPRSNSPTNRKHLQYIYIYLSIFTARPTPPHHSFTGHTSHPHPPNPTHNELLQPAATAGGGSTAARLSAGRVWKGRLSAAGISTAGISTARIPSAAVSRPGLSSTLCTSVRSASPSSTQFIRPRLLGRLFGCSLLLLPVGCVLLRRHSFAQIGSYKCILTLNTMNVVPSFFFFFLIVYFDK